jgi:hypothetical protein
MVAASAGARQTQGNVSPEKSSAISELAERYRATLNLTEVERRERLYAIAEAEHRLGRDELREVTRARLQALLLFDEELEADEIQRLIGSLEVVMDRLPGELAMRRVEFVQTLRHEFSPGDQQRLTRLVPGVLGKRPANSFDAEGDAAPLCGPPRRRFWRR